MAFVCPNDYLFIIRTDVAGMVQEANDAVRLQAERSAQDEIEGYLLHDYNVALALDFDTRALITGAQYTPGQLIVSPAGENYVCIAAGGAAEINDTQKFVKDNFPIPVPYADNTAYTPGQSISAPNRLQYLVIRARPAGGPALDDTAHFFLKRNDLLVMIYLDMAVYHYHARISPNQVPTIRIERYEQAIEKLKRIRRKELTPALPTVAAPDSGGSSGSALASLRSNPKRNNEY